MKLFTFLWQKKNSLTLKEHKANLQAISVKQRSEIQKSADKFERDAEQEAAENAKRIDERIVWLSGGALVVISNITLSPRFEHVQHLEALAIAFIAFGLCLAFAIASYGAAAGFFNTIEAIKILLPTPEKKLNPEDAEKILKNMELQRARGEHYMGIRNFLSRFCYVLCIVGIFSFIIFGIMNLLPGFIF